MVQRRQSPWLIALGCVLAVIAGCESGEPENGGLAIGDTTAIRVAETPRVRVGEMDGPEELVFGQVISPFLLPDGRLVVPDRGDLSVRVFEPDGSFRTMYGRSGDGPGEFRYLSTAWGTGDTIEVYDPFLRRITRFTEDEPPQVVTLSVERSMGAQAARLGDGWAVTILQNPAPVGYWPEGHDPRFKRDTIAIHRFSSDGTDEGELAVVPALRRYRTSDDSSRPEPLSPQGRMRVHAGTIYFGETLARAIRSANPLEGTWTEVPVPLQPHDDPGAAFRAVMDAYDGDGYDDAPVPDALSVFWDFLVDAEGLLWILPYDPLVHAHALGGWVGPGPGGRWRVMTPDGQVVGDVELPPQLYPSQITSDALVGVEIGELGVPSVVVYDLVRDYASR